MKFVARCKNTAWSEEHRRGDGLRMTRVDENKGWVGGSFYDGNTRRFESMLGLEDEIVKDDRRFGLEGNEFWNVSEEGWDAIFV